MLFNKVMLNVGLLLSEEEWPTDEYWREHRSYWYGSEGEPDPGSVTDSGDEQEPRSYLEM